jgi:ATP-binding cassette, subfamily G (WHITE), member 2, PDR
VTLLYEGYQIFFGTILEAKNYFTSMGFVCPENQTTPDFLLSMTDPSQRLIHPGLIAEVPRTPYEFSLVWQKSISRMGLMCGISIYDEEYQVKEQHVGRSTGFFGCHENRTL